MATQRITIAKIGGASGNAVIDLMKQWSGTRQCIKSYGSTYEETWPPGIRQQIDAFAERLRSEGHRLPVVHFVEWIDRWSMGDIFDLSSDEPNPESIFVRGDHYEIRAWLLPDNGRLQQYLAHLGKMPFDETEQYVARLKEAVEAWELLVKEAAVIVLRQYLDGSTLDEEVQASLTQVSSWIDKVER